MTPDLFPTETQSELSFPVSLVEKYRPHEFDGFVGLPKPKAVLKALLAKPRACALLLVGPPGAGKTTMAMAFTNQLKAGLVHIPSQGLTVDAVESTWERIHYYPESGGFWVILCDEADKMSRQAQIALLSKLDSAATLRPQFGGGSQAGKPLPVIWVFNSNGAGLFGTDVPDAFEKRFLSRCLLVPFDTHKLNGELSVFLRQVWDAETDSDESAKPDFESVAENAEGSVRDALQALELALLTHTVDSQASPASGQAVIEPESEAKSPHDILNDALTHVKASNLKYRVDYWEARETCQLIEEAIENLD
jgi:replication-associated recombination protein RarA